MCFFSEYLHIWWTFVADLIRSLIDSLRKYLDFRDNCFTEHYISSEWEGNFIHLRQKWIWKRSCHSMFIQKVYSWVTMSFQRKLKPNHEFSDKRNRGEKRCGKMEKVNFTAQSFQNFQIKILFFVSQDLRGDKIPILSVCCWSS